MSEDAYEQEAHETSGKSKHEDRVLVLRESSSLSIDGLRRPMVLDGGEYRGVTVLCAEPGMGKSYVARKLEHAAKKAGRSVCHYVCDDGDSACISRRIVRRCRDIRVRMGHLEDPLVVFDGVTPGDEADTLREARAIARLAEEGAQVVVCIRPESEQLAEQLEEATCFGTDQLLFRVYAENEDDLDLTGGIPSLVAAHRSDIALGDNREELGRRYLSALAELVGDTLRDGLPAEEGAVRLAMILLGNGKMNDVAMVAGRCDDEQFQWLYRDVTLLGIDMRERTFCCHGLRFDAVFERCMDVLQYAAASMPSLVARACGTLAARGDARRSALVCRLCSTEQAFSQVCMTWGVSYVAMGDGELVEAGLRAARSTSEWESLHGVLSNIAVQSVLGTSRELDSALERLSELRLATTEDDRDVRTTQMLVACRDVLRSPQQASRYLSLSVEGTRDLSLLDHLRVARILTQGHFGEAYAIVSNGMLLQEPGSMGEALVCDDLAIALALYGGTPDRKERAMMAAAEEVFERPGMRVLNVYHTALQSALAVLMSDSLDTTSLEEAAKRAELMGDAYIQAVCLFVTSVADVRAEALTRAHVRASLAASIARSLHEEYLASSAELVDALTYELLGETGSLSAYCKRVERPDDLMMMGRIASAAVDSAPRGRLAELPLGTPCPRDALWVLNMLIGCDSRLKNQLTTLIPPTWFEQLQMAQYQGRAARRRGQDKTGSHDTVSSMRMDASSLEQGVQIEMIAPESSRETIRISVLGGFSVECRGSRVSGAAFERRRSRDLLMLLAITPGHRMRRFQVLDVLWPNDDYYAGPRRLYEATGEARTRLKEAGRSTNPILSDRVQGTIGFDTSLVSCDVDDLEREAQMILAERGDDLWALERAERLERIYAGGPDQHLATLGQAVRDRLNELRILYVDAMVAAGEAALRLGKAKLAVRYGYDAHRQEDLREDAMILLVRALKAAGRAFEVPDLYKRYARRLIEAEGVPPSPALKRVVGDIVERGDGSAR